MLCDLSEIGKLCFRQIFYYSSSWKQYGQKYGNYYWIGWYSMEIDQVGKQAMIENPGRNCLSLRLFQLDSAPADSDWFWGSDPLSDRPHSCRRVF